MKSAPKENTPWLLSLANARIEATWGEAQQRVAVLRSRYGGVPDDELANKLIEDAAFWASIVGVGVGAVQTIPGIGTVIALGTVAPELVYLTKLEFDTALGMAAIYDPLIPSEMLSPMLLACLTYSFGNEFAKDILKESARNLSRRLIENVFKGSTLILAKRMTSALGVHATKKGLLKAVPLVSIPINAGMNYTGLLLFGKMAKHYFSPSWSMCPQCGNLQVRRKRFCTQCSAEMPPA